MTTTIRLGPTQLDDDRYRFLVWAPRAEMVEVRLGADNRRVALKRMDDGYHQAVVPGVPAGTRYVYRLHSPGGEPVERPDPASRCQPEGVHGASELVAGDFAWGDSGWRGLPLSRYVIYELHVGTFTAEGTFDAVVGHLDELVQLGVTAVELMPVAQFPGGRNWGYDGVYPFAAQNSYGGPQGLKRLVNACHRRGLAVVLDVVYNHLGPEGNYLRDFGPYFTDFYRTPWGAAVNFDGPHSDHVRRFFVENALYWTVDCRIDALRLDAVHAILDFSARPFLEQLTRTVHRRAEALNRRIHLIAESALNDTRIIRSRELGGMQLDAQWNDDFHHSLRTALTGETAGYFCDFNGLESLAKAFREGFVYSGQYSRFRQRTHGNSSRNVPARKLVVFAQNHDQVGNRLRGDRLSASVSFEKQKLAAGLVLLSPFVPLLFMGEEYGETAPFPYFVSHGDPELVRAVREGRRREFSGFEWEGEPPDPQDEQTFLQSKLNRSLRHEGRHRILLAFHRQLLAMRRRIPALANLSKKNMSVHSDPGRQALTIRRHFGESAVFVIFTFAGSEGATRILAPAGSWHLRIDSAAECWGGPGSLVPEMLTTGHPTELQTAACSLVLYAQERRPIP
jgi:maltooligosyltrehalose trehalohydrolase